MASTTSLGGMDVIKAWGNSLSQAWSTNPNWFSALWNWVTGGISAIVAGLITLVGYLILPFTYTLFTLFYALYGSILYVVGPFVLALIPSRGLGQLGRTYFVNMMVFQCWGLLYAILQALMSALQITNPMQFNGSFLQAFVGSSQVIVMSVASVLAVDHGRPHPIYRKPHRPRRHRRHPDDRDQWSNDCGSGGIGVGIQRWRRSGCRAAGAIRWAAISPLRWFRRCQSR